VRRAAYQAADRTLLIEFHAGRDGTPHVYSYDDVSEKSYQELLAAQSPGRYLNQNIKHDHHFTQISPAPDDRPVPDPSSWTVIKGSSAIAAIAWRHDPAEGGANVGDMFVEFHPRNGARSIYRYDGVSRDEYERVRDARSVGGEFARSIRRHFPYQPVPVGAGRKTPWMEVNSSSLRRIAYEGGDDNGNLLVEFHRKGTPAVYRYHGVPKATYTALLKADSIGRAFNTAVRPHHDFSRVSEPAQRPTPPADAWHPVRSSMLRRLAWRHDPSEGDAGQGDLFAEFADGRQYRYDGVSRNEFEALLRTQADGGSVGRAFTQTIKRTYPFQKVA
jgi:hypothetical protein